MLASRREDLPPPRPNRRGGGGGPALRPIRRLVEAAVAQTTRPEEHAEMESQDTKRPEQKQDLSLFHVSHLLSSPRT
jgi:hypothetical protein